MFIPTNKGHLALIRERFCISNFSIAMTRHCGGHSSLRKSLFWLTTAERGRVSPSRQRQELQERAGAVLSRRGQGLNHKRKQRGSPGSGTRLWNLKAAPPRSPPHASSSKVTLPIPTPNTKWRAYTSWHEQASRRTPRLEKTVNRTAHSLNDKSEENWLWGDTRTHAHMQALSWTSIAYLYTEKTMATKSCGLCENQIFYTV